jgi:hypothetical protein
MLSKSKASPCIVTLILSFILSDYLSKVLKDKLKLYTANRAFGGLGKFMVIYKNRQIVVFGF